MVGLLGGLASDSFTSNLNVGALLLQCVCRIAFVCELVQLYTQAIEEAASAVAQVVMANAGKELFVDRELGITDPSKNRQPDVWNLSPMVFFFT